MEIYHTGRWWLVAQIELKGAMSQGYRAPVDFSYNDQYAIEYLNCTDYRATSVNYPVNLYFHSLKQWPPFLLDILPAGAARRFWLSELGLGDQPEADWELLCKGAGNAPGNIRVAQAGAGLKVSRHIGFSKEEIVEKNGDFIEYARQYGATVTGSSGAQGDAPKFLLVQDRDDGRWHVDSSIPDEHVAKCWIVKFPRGKSERDREVLKNEAAYMQVAKQFGLRVADLLDYQSDALFIPRFDRLQSATGFERYGLESLASASGLTDYGVGVTHELLTTTISKTVDNVHLELREYLLRDILNLALGNTDNHARNSAFIKKPNQPVELSPLYDFAPMFRDPEGIPRACRWNSEHAGSLPDWQSVLDSLGGLGLDARTMRLELVKRAGELEELPDRLQQAGADLELIIALGGRMKALATSIAQLEK